jgi:hypothetical protein
MQKHNTESLTHKHTKFNSKCINDLNKRTSSVQLLHEKIGEYLHDLGFSHVILDITLKTQATKEK